MPQRKLFDKKTLDTLKKHPLYSQDGKGDEAIAYARIFNPYGRGAWYITEYDGDDTMFGYYRNDDHSSNGDYDDEYGYFSRRELENARVNVMGARLPLERDAYYEPANMGQVKRGEGPRSAMSRTSNAAFANSRENNATANSTASGGKG